MTEVAHVAKDRGQRSIYVASDLLAEEPRRRRADRPRSASDDRAGARRSATASAFTPAPRPSSCRRPAVSGRRCKIRKNGEEVDGKSILGILLLAASQGTRITLAVSGEDEKDAFAAVEDLIARSFDEEE